MGLMPNEFWSLTVREFWIKWHAYVRTEDRRRALAIEHAALTGHYDDRHRARLHRSVNQLRRYPLKRWLLPDAPTS